MKRKVCKVVVRPAVHQEEEMEVAEWKMLRFLLGVSEEGHD